jgi:hypothetical protein
MNVIDRAGINVGFRAIPIAYCFEFEHEIFMRIIETSISPGIKVNCVNVSNGQLFYIEPDSLVTPVDGNFMITRRGIWHEV